MPEGSMIGTRIRERRVMNGIRQSDLARMVGISPSYLNLIEHNRRRIGGKTLLKLAEALDVEPSALSEGAEATLLAALREAAGSQTGLRVETDRVQEFAGRFSGWAHLLARLHARVEGLERTVETLTDRLAHDPHLAASLHEVISSVTAIRSTSSILVETEALEPEWQARFHRNIDEDSRRLAEGAKSLVRYLEGAASSEADIKSPQDELQAFLARHGFHFPSLEGQATGTFEITNIIEAAEELGTEAARRLARDTLEQYRADARVLQLGPFLQEVRRDPSPERLAQVFCCGLPLIFRRLAALPQNEVGPIGLVICDMSGALVFRRPFSGFVMPRDAAACALWPLFQVLGQPQVPVRAQLRQAGRGQETVLALAAAEQIGAATFDQPALLRAHMLILPVSHGRAGDPVRDVGASCRICPLRECRARREPSIVADGF
jgi:transcriptional regulator with XRE-family HTH domain